MVGFFVSAFPLNSTLIVIADNLVHFSLGSFRSAIAPGAAHVVHYVSHLFVRQQAFVARHHKRDSALGLRGVRPVSDHAD